MKKILFWLWGLLPNHLKNLVRVALGRETFRIHPNAASDGKTMIKWVNKVSRLSNIVITNIFEIGANYGQDAEFMRHYLKLDSKDVYVFEPHPQIISELRRYYPEMNAFDYAISNINGVSAFHAIDLTKHKNSGISSLLNHSLVDKNYYFNVSVQLMRMDKFMKLHYITSVDFVKLDVEGFTYQVLEGFGERLRDVKCVQLEAEHVELFEGQKLFGEISTLLSDNNFCMVYFEMLNGQQSDSLWIKQDFLAC